MLTGKSIWQLSKVILRNGFILDFDQGFRGGNNDRMLMASTGKAA